MSIKDSIVGFYSVNVTTLTRICELSSPYNHCFGILANCMKDNEGLFP